MEPRRSDRSTPKTVSWLVAALALLAGSLSAAFAKSTVQNLGYFRTGPNGGLQGPLCLAVGSTSRPTPHSSKPADTGFIPAAMQIVGRWKDWWNKLRHAVPHIEVENQLPAGELAAEQR